MDLKIKGLKNKVWGDYPVPEKQVWIYYYYNNKIILAGYLEEMLSDHTSLGAEQNKEHVLEDPGSTPPS